MLCSIEVPKKRSLESLESLDSRSSKVSKLDISDSANTSAFPSIESSSSTEFILDSGASRHIISNRDYFISITNKPTLIRWGNAGKITAYGVGNIKIKTLDTNKVLVLKDCLYAPEFNVNLISLSRLDNRNVYARLREGVIDLFNAYDSLIAKAYKENSLYKLKVDKPLSKNKASKESMLLLGSNKDEDLET